MRRYLLILFASVLVTSCKQDTTTEFIKILDVTPTTQRPLGLTCPKSTIARMRETGTRR